MRILITGGSGFIGSNLANFFLNNGHEVTTFDNLSRKGTNKNLDWLKQIHGDKLKFINGDVRKLEDLTPTTKDVDLILHTAAQVAVTTSILNPLDDFSINAIGTLNVLEAARLSNNNPIIMFTSTNKVYGNNVNLIDLAEKQTQYEFANPSFALGIPESFSTDAHEHTPYGNSKYIADLYVRDYFAVYGLPSVVFRMSCIYGTRQFGNEDQGWVAHFIISNLLGKSLTFYGDGKQVRDILFIDDLVRAFDMASKNINKTKGQAFNMGGGPQNTISLLQLVSMLEQFTGKKINYNIDKWRPFDQKVYISDIRKAKEDFGWEPQISAEQGIKKLHDWVSSNINLFK